MTEGGGGGGGSTGLDTNVGGALCYLLMWITGIVFLLVEQKDKQIRFHAYQSLGTFLTLTLLSWLAPALPVIGGLASVALVVVTLVLWLVLMVRTFQGETLTLPVVGDWAERQAAAG